MTDDGIFPLRVEQRRDLMKAPDDVSAMLRLKALGWGSKRIAAELGCSRNTVRHWLMAGDWRPYASPSRSKKLDGLSEWLRERFARHGGNAVVAAARAAAPCILFIDELDSVQSRGATRADEWWTAIINALLAELDGVEGRDGVVVVGASNFSERVDPAIRRSGRLDREIRLTLPDVAALEKILAVHLGSAAACLDLAAIARRMLGSSGADVERVSRGGRRRARQAGRPLRTEDLLADVGADRPARTPAAARRVAIHEAGHAVVSALQHPMSVLSVSIRPDGIRAGGTRTVPRAGEDTEARIEALMRALLAPPRRSCLAMPAREAEDLLKAIWLPRRCWRRAWRFPGAFLDSHGWETHRRIPCHRCC